MTKELKKEIEKNFNNDIDNKLNPLYGISQVIHGKDLDELKELFVAVGNFGYEMYEEDFNKKIEELKKEIELWKKKYYTAQKVFCKHNDKVKEDNERNLRVGKNWRKAYFQLQSDFNKKIEEKINLAEKQIKIYQEQNYKGKHLEVLQLKIQVLNEVKEIFSKEDNHSQTSQGGSSERKKSDKRDSGKNPFSEKKFISSNPDTHNPTGQADKAKSITQTSKPNVETAPEDVCANCGKTKINHFEDWKGDKIYCSKFSNTEKFKPKKQKGCGKDE